MIRDNYQDWEDHEEWEEDDELDYWDENDGGTGHGDESYSDADNGL